MIFSSVASMLLCTRSYFLFVSRTSPPCICLYQVMQFLLLGYLQAHCRSSGTSSCDSRTVIGVSNYSEQNLLAVVVNTELGSNSAAPKRTLQVDMDVWCVKMWDVKYRVCETCANDVIWKLLFAFMHFNDKDIVVITVCSNRSMTGNALVQCVADYLITSSVALFISASSTRK